jgi:hypothetical protein
VSEREHRQQFVYLTLLQTRGSELCHAIIGPPRVRNHLSEGMRIAALHHTKMVKELTVLEKVVSAAVEFMLGRSPYETFQVEVVDELVPEFQKPEEQNSRLAP